MIFSKLPRDIIDMILLYDEHFIRRKGKIVSIIPKSDDRYKILSFITLNTWNFSEFSFKKIYNYKFNNVYNYEERDIDNPDFIQVIIKENKNDTSYSIWTGKQYPKSFCNKEQPFLTESPDYCWKYLSYEYTR